VAEALNLSAKRSTREYGARENLKLPQRKRKARRSSKRQRRKSASVRQSLKSLLEKFEAVGPSEFFKLKGIEKKWPNRSTTNVEVIDHHKYTEELQHRRQRQLLEKNYMSGKIGSAV